MNQRSYSADYLMARLHAIALDVSDSPLSGFCSSDSPLTIEEARDILLLIEEAKTQAMNPASK